MLENPNVNVLLLRWYPLEICIDVAQHEPAPPTGQINA